MFRGASVNLNSLFEVAPQFMAPMAVLGAFSAELYLKAFLISEGAVVPLKHSLLELYNLLTPGSKLMLKQRYDNAYLPLLLKRNLLAMPNLPSDISLPSIEFASVLRASSQVFVTWRYLAWSNPPDSSGWEPALAEAMRDVLLQKHATWKPLALGMEARN